MSKGQVIPSRINEHIRELAKHNYQPCGMTNNSLNPVFTIKEDNLMSLNVAFTPKPTCYCDNYIKSISELPVPICHHILYVLINYYKINPLTVNMYHKLPPNFYELLVSYIDTWINAKYGKQPKRKKKNYNFLRETLELKETSENTAILNPLKQYYYKDECAICMDPLCYQQLIICPECHNYTHSKCYWKWAVKKKGCHLCRDNPAKTKAAEDEEFPTLYQKK